MTIIIGIKSKEGCVLASDCKITTEESRDDYQDSKLRYGVNVIDNRLSGAYVGFAGNIFCLGSIIDSRTGYSKNLSKFYDLASDLTSLEISEISSKEINASLDQLYSSDLSKKEDFVSRQKLRSEENKLERMLSSRRLIEATKNTDNAFPILKFSSYNPSDICYVANGKVIVEDCFVQGESSTMKKLNYKLQKNYKVDGSLDEAVNLARDLMNTALDQDDLFRGYEFVVVKNNVKGSPVILKTIDLNAKVIPKEIYNMGFVEEKFVESTY